MPTHSTTPALTIPSAILAALSITLLALSSCKTDPAGNATTRSQRQKTIDEVSIQTTSNRVTIEATTQSGRRLKSSGATTKEAVDNLEKAAAR